MSLCATRGLGALGERGVIPFIRVLAMGGVANAEQGHDAVPVQVSGKGAMKALPHLLPCSRDRMTPVSLEALP